MIGLTGAHRTGKTTLAQAYAKMTGVPYVALPPVIKEMGLTPGDLTDLETRLRVQETLLSRAEEIYDGLKGTFITDRTPLDLAAYTLADVGQSEESNLVERVQKYLSRCFEVINRHFSCVIYVPIAIPYVAEEGKPAPNLAYQEHIAILIKGLIFDPRFHRASYSINLENTDLQGRLATVSIVCQRTLHEYSAHRQHVTYH